jgi:phosphoglycolate phosphatase-like HAD superfamily hydrolase
VIRLVLFDIDGTLIRTGGAGVLAFERTFALEFGVPNATREVSFAGRTDTSLVRELFRRHGIPEMPENFRRFFDVYVFLLHHLLDETCGAPCTGVISFIHGLKSLPDPPVLGLLTGNIRLGSEIKLRHYGLWDYFEMGAFGDDHENRNELAAIGQRRGSELLGRNLEGKEILVVGDTPLDIHCAQAIGARMLAVGTGGYTCEALGACRPTWVVENLTGIEPGEICRPLVASPIRQPGRAPA